MQANLFFLKTMLNKVFSTLPRGGTTISLLLRNKIDLLHGNKTHKLPSNLKTKFRHYVAALIIICCTASNAGAQIITATATQPFEYGGCIDSIFTLTYISTGPHTLTINATLASPPNNCGGQGTHPQVVILFTSLNGGNLISVDSAGSMMCNITAPNNATVFLQYRVLVDCSVASVGNSQSTYNLQQVFTIPNITLLINGGNNITLRTNLSSPTVQLDNLSTSYKVNYLNTNYITVRYTNYSNLPAHIRFRYDAGDETMCGFGTIDSFAYSTNGINFTNYTQNTIANVVIPPINGSLYIRQRAIADSCIFPICTNTCILQWQCDYDTTFGNLFCDACVRQEVFNYFITSNDSPAAKIIEISPALNGTQDFSCFNDTAMVDWEYIVVHDAASIGAMDTLIVTLHSSALSYYTQGFGEPALTIIPTSSLQIMRTGSSILYDTISYASAQLCSIYITDPLKWLTIKAADFLIGDTLRIKFKTFRCAEDNPILLDNAKILNHWRIDATPISICGPKAGKTKVLSKEMVGGNSNIHQQLQMFPSTTQLTVPVDSMFGDSLPLQVDVRKFVNQNLAGMFQYLGCTQKFTDTACHADGIWRVKVDLGRGLRIQQPWQVHLYKDTTITIAVYPDYFYDNVNDTLCKPGSYYFYFHFSDTLKMMMEQGTLALTVQSCCGDTTNDNPVHIGISSHIMPDATGSCIGAVYPTPNHDTQPTFNTGQAFIPLATAEHIIHVHCPGCLAPGVIADRYRLSRTSFGLQDSNNDGIADDSLLQVTPDSSYYINHSNKIARNNSSVGDMLQDYVTAHLQDGDPTLGGYSYAQMQALGAKLNYLNISVIIPSAFDTLGLTPVGYDFYIDIDTALAPCIDCDKFEVSANFKTILHIFVPTASMANFMQMITTQNKFYYTFSALNNSAQYILNPANSNILYNDGTFNGYDVNQRYRLSTRYLECNTWNYGTMQR